MPQPSFHSGCGFSNTPSRHCAEAFIRSSRGPSAPFPIGTQAWISATPANTNVAPSTARAIHLRRRRRLDFCSGVGLAVADTLDPSSPADSTHFPPAGPGVTVAAVRFACDRLFLCALTTTLALACESRKSPAADRAPAVEPAPTPTPAPTPKL